MAELPTLTVDARDMLCAQALAVVAQAVNALQPSQALDVMYNTMDVAADLRVWAASQGHSVHERAHRTLRILPHREHTR
ncbi:MAG: hypothetical protein HY352_06630 [Candidatus Omnitrophica bacterium]|nr:hypothetical protein [Candidatus Omnitrophota bacterium]